MHYRDYLTALPSEERRVLGNDLTVGCGHLAFMARSLGRQPDPDTGVLLGRLALVYASLRAAHTAFDPTATPTIVATLAGAGGDVLPPRWQILLADRDGEGIEVWLQIATEAARAVVGAIAADADLDQVREALGVAIHALVVVRDIILGTP